MGVFKSNELAKVLESVVIITDLPNETPGKLGRLASLCNMDYLRKT